VRGLDQDMLDAQLGERHGGAETRGPGPGDGDIDIGFHRRNTPSSGRAVGVVSVTKRR